MNGSEQQSSRFDSGCSTCDDVNVSNAVHGVLQLASCDTSDPDDIEEAVEYVREKAHEVNNE